LSDAPNRPSPSPYLRNRPFLVIRIKRMPEKHARTEKAGWMKQDLNWRDAEEREVVDSVTPKVMREAAIIIDIINQTTVKDRTGGNSTQTALRYLAKYKADVERAMMIWYGKLARASR